LHFAFLLASVGGRAANTRAAAPSQLPVFFLNYAETNGGNEGRVFSDQFAEPEGPHITTDALSAQRA
jgi:hypothetical protein